jgi:hypothetical protein
VWRFDAFVLDAQRYQLRGGDEVIRVEPQVFDVLTQLVRNCHRFVSKEELFDSVWGGRFVGEAAATSSSAGSAADNQSEPAAESEPEPAPRQHIAFCRAADGVRLAYAIAGEGPPLVRAANWMTHLGYDIESPVWKHWVRDLSLEHRFIRYDERGCGLSDWEATDFTFDDRVADLESVVESPGLERFPLLGVSQGGAVCGGLRRSSPRARQPPGVVRRVCPWPRGAGGRQRGKARSGVGSRARQGRLGT